MDERYIRELLEGVRKGSVGEDDAVEMLKDLPYRDMGFAKIDNHRAIRTGFPEVVFGQGKTSEQIRDIMKALSEKGGNIMATRTTPEDFEVVKEALPGAVYFDKACITALLQNDRGGDGDHPVAVVTAGTADMKVAEEAAVTLEILGNTVERVYDVGVAGIHRVLNRVETIRKCSVVIVVAGMEGALASVVGGLVDSPVIAVPTSIGYGANFGGLSALLSMLNSCANGISVVNIDNGYGAACSAALINRKICEDR